MTSSQKNAATTQETPPVENNAMVRARLRTLLELAVAIGRQEGLLGNNGNSNTEGGKDVADKGNIRGYKVTETGENQAGDKEGKR